MDDMSVYIVNLSRYASGRDTGAWFKLPLNAEHVAEVLGLNGYESEYAIHDVEGIPVDIGEYMTIEEINRMYEQMMELPDYVRNDLQEFVWCFGSVADVYEACENGRIGYYPGCADEVELAHYLIDECQVLGEIPEPLRMYISYEAFSRDYSINNQLIRVKDGMCVLYRG